MFTAFSRTNKFFDAIVKANHPILYFMGWTLLINVLTTSIEVASIFGLIYQINVFDNVFANGALNITKMVMLLVLIVYTMSMSAYWTITKYEQMKDIHYAHEKTTTKKAIEPSVSTTDTVTTPEDSRRSRHMTNA